jgi:hypothetical protein
MGADTGAMRVIAGRELERQIEKRERDLAARSDAQR